MGSFSPMDRADFAIPSWLREIRDPYVNVFHTTWNEPSKLFCSRLGATFLTFKDSLMPQPAPLRKLATCFATSLVIIVSGLLLSGCAGGGGSSTPPPPQSNPVPTISSISPSSLTEGATATTVTVNGTGFIQSSTVLWNQSSRPTTYVSSSELQAAIPVTDLAVAGTAQIVVSNPSPGGGCIRGRDIDDQ